MLKMVFDQLECQFSQVGRTCGAGGGGEGGMLGRNVEHDVIVACDVNNYTDATNLPTVSYFFNTPRPPTLTFNNKWSPNLGNFQFA